MSGTPSSRLHVHWFSRVVWTSADGLHPPYKLCRCGATKWGDFARWGVGMDGEWFYAEASFE